METRPSYPLIYNVNRPLSYDPSTGTVVPVGNSFMYGINRGIPDGTGPWSGSAMCPYYGMGYMGGFWDDVGDFFTDVWGYIKKMAPALTPILSAIPVAGPFLEMGLMAAIAAEKMYNAYKNKDIKGGYEAGKEAYESFESMSGFGYMGGEYAKRMLLRKYRLSPKIQDQLEAEVTALAMLNYQREKEGKPKWEGTWQEYLDKKLGAFRKSADKAFKNMYKKMLLTQEAIFDIGKKAAADSAYPAVITRAEYGKFTKYLPMKDKDFKDGYDKDLWRQIGASPEFAKYAEFLKKNLPFPDVNDYKADVQAIGADKASDKIEAMIDTAAEQMFRWIAKRYMLMIIVGRLDIPHYTNMPYPEVAEWYVRFLEGGKQGTRQVRTKTKPRMTGKTRFLPGLPTDESVQSTEDVSRKKKRIGIPRRSKSRGRSIFQAFGVPAREEKKKKSSRKTGSTRPMLFF